MTAQLTLVMMVLFLVKHFICDFLLQTTNIAMNKHNSSTLESYAHSAFHAIGAIIVLGICGFGQFWYIGLITGLVHYGIDWTKGNLTNTLNLTPNDTYFWWLLGADQLAHSLTYALAVYFMI